MRQPFHPAHLGALACALAMCGASAQKLDDSTVAPAVVQHQQQEIRKGDPDRWYKQDATQQARLRNLQKEINAAYAESKAACREQPKDQRASCLKDARTTYESDLANARNQVQAAPEGQVSTTTTEQ
jgi:hypothetical protein